MTIINSYMTDITYTNYPNGITSNGGILTNMSITSLANPQDLLTDINAGHLNYLSYVNSASAPIADLTTSIQNFLLYCQRVALQLKATNLTDQIQRSGVDAYIPDGYYSITSPLIIPEYVNLISQGIIVRNGQSGTITSFYTGDTTSKAFANLYMPSVIMTPRSHCEKINIYCNSNGSDRGSGLAVGKNWTMSSVSITNGGVGYSVNDILTFYNPSISPYIAAKATVNTVNGSGVITGISLTTNGAYGLPPILQKLQWISENSFTGAFDSSGNLSVSGGTGTAASLAPTWRSDWDVAGGKNYLMGQSGLISDYILDHIYISQSQRLFDNTTYGAIFATKFSGLNFKIGEIETQSGFYGIMLDHASDFEANKLNPVDAQCGVFISGGGSISCPQTIIDTPTGNTTSLSIDGADRVNLKGTIFFRNLSNQGASPPATIQIGGNSTSSSITNNIELDFSLEAAGTAGDSSHLSSIGCAALSLAYVHNYNIDLNIINSIPNYSGRFPVVSSLVSFGSGALNGTIRANTELMFGKLYNGTIPAGCNFNVNDADIALTNATVTATITGSATNGDQVNITLTNTDMAVAYNWPITVAFTVTTGLTTTQIATGIAAAINANAVFQITGVAATSSNNIVTIYEAGFIANSTIVTSSVTGSATEIVTLSNAGVMSGGIFGGTMGRNGLYQLAMAGSPTNGSLGTGWGKALAGSQVVDTTGNNIYINTGNETSPTWTLSLLSSSGLNASNINSGTIGQTNLPAMLATSGTFTSKPGSPITGQLYLATDLGNAGVWITYDGTKWKPLTGIAILYSDSTYRSITATGAEANVTSYKIPGGLVSANGAIELFTQGRYTGTAGTKTAIIRHNTNSGATSGGTTLINNLNGGSNTALNASFFKLIQNTATNSQILGPTNSNQCGGTTGTAGFQTGSIDMTADSYINLNINGTASDTVGFQSSLIKWIEP